MVMISEERKREIRKQEIEHACDDIAASLKIDPEGIVEKLGWVFWEYDRTVRRHWSGRDFWASMREMWRVEEKGERAEKSREAKLRRLIEHPSTSENERAAARRALERIT